MDATKCDMELMDAYGPTRERCVLTLKGLGAVGYSRFGLFPATGAWCFEP